MPASEPTTSEKTTSSALTPQGSLRWLHLSDIHFWAKNDWRDDAARSKLITMLSEQFASGKLPKPDLIFCTGDIAQGETKPNELSDQYKSAKAFFNQVLKVCGVKKQCLFVVPGNHDVNRNSVNEIFQDGLRRQKLDKVVDSWAKKDVVFSDAIKRMDEYGAFIKSYLPHQARKVDEKSRHCYCKTLSINGVRIGIAGFNSAWTCFDDHDQNQLWMAAEWQFNSAEKAFHKNTDLRIGLMHHPTSWLQSEEASLAKKRIHADFHFWLHGHEHDTWVTATDGEVMIAAGAVNAKTDSEFGINFVDLQLVEGRGRIHLFAYNTQENQWHIRPAPNAPQGVREITCVKLQSSTTLAEVRTAMTADLALGADPIEVNDESNGDLRSYQSNSKPNAHIETGDEQHPLQQAIVTLEANIAEAWADDDAHHFRTTLCTQLRLPATASSGDVTDKLDAILDVEQQMHCVQEALVGAAKRHSLAHNLSGEPHAIERAAAALYMRATLRCANIIAIEASCMKGAGVTTAPAYSEVLIAILAAVLHGEVHSLSLKRKLNVRGKDEWSPCGDNLMDFGDTPFYPIKAEADLSHAVAMKIDKRYSADAPPQTGPDLLKLQEHVKRRMLQCKRVYRKSFRAIVSEKSADFLKDEATLAELYIKLNLPFTRVVENENLDISNFFSVSLAQIDDLFLQFLEVLDDAKQPTRIKQEDA